jgi:ubiquinone/menaquinone biosynthesis C-methylase UbiE
MSEHRVDYDHLAPAYDARYEVDTLQPVAEALLPLARDRMVLEVGCGTGRWMRDIRVAADFVVGVDASFGMLRQRQLGAEYVNAHANALPFGPSTFDLIYCVNALHHFDDKRAFVNEAAVMLKPGGALAIVGIDPRTIRRRYLYDFFDGTRARDLERYPSFGELVDWISAAGLDEADHTIVHTWSSRFDGVSVLSDPFLKQNSNSTLALLSDADYKAGMRRISEAAQRGTVFETALPFGMTTGRRPDAT